MPRVIEVKGPITPSTIHKVIERVGEIEFNRAFTYLATWGMLHEEQNDYVEINICHDNEMTAYYKRTKEQTTRGLLMGAVWRYTENKYTFHT